MSVTVRSLPGEVLALFELGSLTVEQLKNEIEERTSCPPALQRLLLLGSVQPLDDGESLPQQEKLEVALIVDETPLSTWDIKGNSCKDVLVMDGSKLRCPRLRMDFVNVLTQEPLRSGAHYFQFVMHSIGDEQWCGVVAENCAGSGCSGRNLSEDFNGRLYYCGRMHSDRHSIVDGHGALHANDRAAASFKTLKPSGDVIGVLVDLGAKAVAFDLNGELQGACAVDGGPLYLVTHLDEPEDCVELRKLPLPEAPEASRAAVAGPLLDLSKGPKLWGGYGSDSDATYSEDDTADESEGSAGS